MDTEPFCWKVMHAPLVFSPRALTPIPELMHEPLFSAFLHHFPDSHR